MPIFSDRACDYSVTTTGIMLGILVIGFVAGLNVLVSKGSPWAKGFVVLGVLFCAGKLFMALIAGAQS